MNDTKIKISRNMVGLVSALCLLSAGAIWVRYFDSTNKPDALGLLTRLGITFGAIWIASVKWFGKGGTINLSPKALVAVIAAIIAIHIRPKIAIPAIIVITVLWFLVRPQKSQIDRSKNRGKK